MKEIILSILTILILTNCSNSETKPINNNERLEPVPEPDKHERLIGEAVQKLRTLNYDFSNPDTSLCGITLRNSLSAENILGKENKIDEREQYHFYSLMDSETLTLTQHPGDNRNQISIFNVTYSDKADHNYKQLNFETFKTEKGIKLGMTKNEVIRVLGNSYVAVDSTKNYIEIYYRIESPKDSKTRLLQKNNIPTYYALYGFSENLLKGFEFGFEYP